MLREQLENLKTHLPLGMCMGCGLNLFPSLSHPCLLCVHCWTE